MSTPRLRVRDLTLGYGSFVLMRDVNFDVAADDIFLIMGGSGCGKSSLLRTLMGLKQPQSGQVLYGDTDIWACTEKERRRILRRTGVLFQGGALWSSMTLAENVGLPLQQYTDLDDDEIRIGAVDEQPAGHGEHRRDAGTRGHQQEFLRLALQFQLLLLRAYLPL